uniref:uncharacterized protein LOC129522733 n=1 Tax=Nyctereutes procyonoides TaxID=34880 RepID=UPI0024441B49|nr:uncharacterized protein LOC129522733 [Nyctereutes procyonoides]
MSHPYGNLDWVTPWESVYLLLIGPEAPSGNWALDPRLSLPPSFKKVRSPSRLCNGFFEQAWSPSLQWGWSMPRASLEPLPAVGMVYASAGTSSESPSGQASRPCTCRFCRESWLSCVSSGSPAHTLGKESGHLGPGLRDLTGTNTSANVSLSPSKGRRQFIQLRGHAPAFSSPNTEKWAQGFSTITRGKSQLQTQSLARTT